MNNCLKTNLFPAFKRFLSEFEIVSTENEEIVTDEIALAETSK